MGTDELARWVAFIKKYVVGPQKRKEISPTRADGTPKLPGLRKPRK